ncbi:nitric oxide-associated protein 1 [Amia ocellicauda]|uniref:nitric oxide-associated protein 1 n=1 Tax=Amia ocellicauda TaxID=2972642 RepID=UPI003463C38E
MQRLFQLTLKQYCKCYCSRNLTCLQVQRFGNDIHRLRSTGIPGVPGLITTGQSFKSKSPTCISDHALVRCYSGGGGSERTIRERAKASYRYTSVDPEREEEFVFVDYTSTPEETSDDHFEIPALGACPQSTEKKAKHGSGTEVYHRAIELQRQYLETVMNPESEIEFHDAGFPPHNVNSKKKKKHKIYGTPDKGVPLSDTHCSGCGALMHCTEPLLPGYVPSEKYKRLVEEKKLDTSVCQRCYLIVHHQKALHVQVSKEEYRGIVSRIRQEKALVLLIVDVLDLPDSIIPDLLELVGENKNIVVLGNKIDLLPADSSNYLKRVKRQLLAYCVEAGISSDRNITDVHLISAKTGYGIENLISSLQSSWKYKGDVYLVGTTNVGKSTLFNTLLESDYCKSKAPEVIQKATISRWPGTTLNLLKFPIINPTPYRMFRRSERLKGDASQSDKDLSPQELKRLQQLRRQGYLVGRVGRTFRSAGQSYRDADVVEFDYEDLSLAGEEEEGSGSVLKPTKPVEFTHNELKDAHWLYDTPGIVKEQCVLSLLTDQELKMVVPTHAITPRTFVLKPGMVLFLGALGRIDFLKGEKSCWLSVISSNLLPVHITSLERADEIYQKHAGKALLGVPIGDDERMKQFPPLVPQDVELRGVGPELAVADIKFSSAGWVAVTAQAEDQLLLRVHVPAGAGLGLRTPPLLPHVVLLKGERIRKSPAYKTKKPTAMLDNSRSTAGAGRLQFKKIKK